MILNGNQRGGAKDLAVHLLKPENDHVQVHELRGFVSDDLLGAFTESYAISRGTRCKQFLYSLSLNPPEGARVTTQAFEKAADKVEKRLGLDGQPRAIVFHEKSGRRHAHVVWSRIDPQEMKAVQLSHSKRKLREISRELFREHGWEMPKGLIDREARDPKNFSLAEWQQARRVGKDPRQIKASIQDAWAISDTRGALEAALDERGLVLARGDRRGFVVLDRDGEIYSLPKWAGLKTKDVRSRLGPEKALPTVAVARGRIAKAMTPAVQRIEAERRRMAKLQNRQLEHERQRLIKAQQDERKRFDLALQARAFREAKQRQDRYRKGFAGLWDILRGESARIRKQNELEAWQDIKRDQPQRDRLVFKHIETRRALMERQRSMHTENRDLKQELRKAAMGYGAMSDEARQAQREAMLERLRRQAKGRNHLRDSLDL
ncbi:MAG: relaxase/mobilization nuclease domain-containing protein [Oceanicaulis sp.]